MGNRGTTPSWDEEEITKWGLMGHFANVRRGLRINQIAARKHELRKLLELLRSLLEAKQEEVE